MMRGDAPVALAVLDIVRIVALGADKPALGAVTGPFTDPFAMDAFPPVPIDFSVAFSAQHLRLVEADRIVAMIDQFVALFGMMAVEAPDGTAAVR